MSDQRPPEPHGDGDLPPTHRPYGDRSEPSGFASPSGPEAEPPTYEPYSATPPYGPAQPGPPYGPPQQPAPGYGYGHGYGHAYGYASAPDHPQASTAFVLGLVSLIGGFFCALPLLVGPFAWVTGARARREIDEQQGRYGGRDKATAGMVMGMVATGLVALALLVVAGAVVVIAAAA